MVGETLKERKAHLEQLLGEWPSKEGIVASWANKIRNEFEVQRGLVDNRMNSLRKR